MYYYQPALYVKFNLHFARTDETGLRRDTPRTQQQSAHTNLVHRLASRSIPSLGVWAAYL